MKTEDKIKELELEVARLKGVIEGMTKVNPIPYPIPYYPRAYPYTWCSTTSDNAPLSGTTVTGTSYHGN